MALYGRPNECPFCGSKDFEIGAQKFKCNKCGHAGYWGLDVLEAAANVLTKVKMEQDLDGAYKITDIPSLLELCEALKVLEGSLMNLHYGVQ